MELIVDRTVLASELGLLQGIVEKRNTLPVLAHLLLRGEKAESGPLGRAVLSATDLEIGLVTEFEAQCVRPGGLTVSAKKLFEIVRSLPDADVHLQSRDGRTLSISCGRSQYSLVGLPETEFPAIPVCPQKHEVELPRDLLVRLVSQTGFAITTDESRFAVSGGLVVFGKGQLAIVATDGHRLAYAVGALPGAEPSPQILLPRKTLMELKRLLEGDEESLVFSRDDKHVFFRSKSRTMISRTLEGSFPQYEKVIPLGHPRVFTLDREELAASVKRVAILSSDRTHAIKVGFTAERIELSAESPDMGEAKEHIPYESSGPELLVSFNAHYLLDFLSAVGTEKIEIRLKDSETQALFLPAGEPGQKVEDTPYRYVIMPMRV
ncbi:MAG: DNA polymerase III subunit beta [Acidobacteriota bacterium]